MTRYTALIDGEAGAYGVSFPDLPGCVAMGHTIDDAMRQAAEVLREWTAEMHARGLPVAEPRTPDALAADAEVAADLANGAMLASIALVQEARRPKTANMSIDAGILAGIDAEAARMGVSRSRVVEIMAMRTLVEMG
jgi:predicted RNase H-like HicB family nuclease